MTTIQVDEDTANVLTQLATVHHMSVPELLRTLAERGSAARPSASAVDFDQELDSLLFDGPTLPADFSRADFYRDHD
jgi:hypothetical protein